MDFRVLGPLEVLVDGELLGLGGQKQRTVLALLVASAGRSITTDSLIAGVYGDDAAPSAKRTIHTYVSNLRHQLGDAIGRRGDGYELLAAPEQIDSHCFESVYRDALSYLPDDPDTAAQLLRRSLGMWRGRPYGDVDGSSVIDIEATRLVELRVAALQARIEADLALGLHQELIGELGALVAEFPYQERFHVQHMLALYRSDRQTDALRAYARARTTLALDLGLEPGPEMQHLESAILRHDPALDLEVRPAIETRAILVADLVEEERGGSPRWRDAVLARRDAVLEAEVPQRAGAVIGLRGTAVYAAFPRVADALEVARKLLAEQLAVAVDFGEVEVRGEEVSGPPVGRSARLVATAHPGQVVISDQAQRALSESGTAGWSVMSLGRHRIRGVDDPLTIFQVTGNGLDDRHPPLRLDRLPPPVPGGQPAVAGYELRGVLGEDEHSTLYSGYQHSVGREVMVRVFPRELVADARFIRRFEAEMQRVVRLVHPHVLPVLDYWREPERAVIISRSPGPTSLDGLRSTDPGTDRILAVIQRLGAALGHAHDAGVVHGGLDPRSVAMDADANPYVHGLGLATLVDGILPRRSGAYSAPEILDGDISVLADVFSLGAITAEMFTGSPLPLDRGIPHVDNPAGDVIDAAIAVDPSARFASVDAFVAALTEALDRGRGRRRPGRHPVRSPYLGLEAFTSADAEYFFGRSALTAELVRAVEAESLVVVVGPSGVGKSSAVSAGLVPALRSGAVPGSENWRYTEMLPGSSPFDELGTALTRIATDRPQGLVGALRTGEVTLHDACRALCGRDTALVVIDQFEEVFTHGHDDGERAAFLSLLAAAVEAPFPAVKLVITLRADYFDRPLADPRFGEAIRDRLVAVQAMSAAELAEAIRLPAERVGVGVDDDLVATMADDAVRQPGGLPLLQYTLTELFEDRRSDRLGMAEYQEAGGLVGSIGRRAERIHGDLGEAGRAVVRDVFVRLVNVNEGREDTRRRVRRSELEQSFPDHRGLAEVLEEFGRGRLLVFDRDADSRGPTVELAHEAILGEWDRLAGWIDAARDGLLVRRRVEVAAREWETADQDESYLLAGARLELAEQWHRAGGLEFTRTEEDFLSESRRYADQHALRTYRMRRRVLVGLLAALVAVTSLGAIAAAQRSDARRTALEYQTGELAAAARLASGTADPDLGLLLALEAYEISGELSDTPQPGVYEALHEAVQGSRLERVIPGGSWWGVLSISPDGRYVATDDPADPTRLLVHDIDTGALVTGGRLAAPIGDVEYSRDGSMIAVTFDPDRLSPAEHSQPRGGSAGAVVRASDLTEQVALAGEPPAFWTDWSSDGGEVLAGSPNGLRVWDAASGELQRTIGDDLNAYSAVVPGTGLVAVERAGLVELVDIGSGEVTRSFAPPVVNAVMFGFSPDARSMVFADWSGRRIIVADGMSGTPTAEFDHPSPVAATFSPDGRRLAVHGNHDSVTVLDVDTGETLDLRGHGSASARALFTPEGDRLVAVTDELGTKVWNTTAQGPPDIGNIVLPGGLMPSSLAPGNGILVAVYRAGPDEFAGVTVDTATGAIREVGRFWGAIWRTPVFSADGSLVGGFAVDGGPASVIDVATGEIVLRLGPCETVKVVDALNERVLVEAECPDSSPPLGARRGFVDLAGGDLVAGLGDAAVVDWATQGRPATPSEDLVVYRDAFRLFFARGSTGELLAAWDVPEGLAPLFLDFSTDGRTLALSSQSGSGVLFDTGAILAGAQPEGAMRIFDEMSTGPNHHVLPVGDHLVSSGGGSEIRLWEASTARLLADLPTGSGDSADVIALPDGSAIFYEDADGLLRRLVPDIDALADLARHRVQRDFTAAECTRYLQAAACQPPG